MSRLIVISNRVQPPTTGPGGNQGGLAVALLAALREHGPCPAHRRSFAPVAECQPQPATAQF